MLAASEKKKSIVEVQPTLAAKWIECGDAVLVDVREDFEHATERIDGAHCCPLSQFDPDALQRRFEGKRVVFHCRSGKRAAKAAERWPTGDEPAFHLAGGIEGWKHAGLHTIRAPGLPKFDAMRQTQVVIGSLVLGGTLLGAFVSPWLLIISGFMGAGLIFAGLSGTCGMAVAISKLPWNRGSAACRMT